MKARKIIADPQYDEARVRSAVKWNQQWGQHFNGLYYDEELDGPNGMAYQIFATRDTDDEQIRTAVDQCNTEQDATHIEVIICPAEWLALPEPASVNPTVQTLRDIVANSSATTLRWKGERTGQLVDITTANILVTVYDAISKPETRAKVDQMISGSRVQFLAFVDTAWKCVS